MVHNLALARDEPLLERGAAWASSPREPASRSDVVVASLPGPRRSAPRWRGEDGVTAGVCPGATTVARADEVGTSLPTGASTRARDAAIERYGAESGVLTHSRLLEDETGTLVRP